VRRKRAWVTGRTHGRTLLRRRGAIALRRGAVALWRSHAVPYCCPTTGVKGAQRRSRGNATKKWVRRQSTLAGRRGAVAGLAALLVWICAVRGAGAKRVVVISIRLKQERPRKHDKKNAFAVPGGGMP
jgi:hypothetical protein